MGPLEYTTTPEPFSTPESLLQVSPTTAGSTESRMAVPSEGPLPVLPDTGVFATVLTLTTVLGRSTAPAAMSTSAQTSAATTPEIAPTSQERGSVSAKPAANIASRRWRRSRGVGADLRRVPPQAVVGRQPRHAWSLVVLVTRTMRRLFYWIHADVEVTEPFVPADIGSPADRGPTVAAGEDVVAGRAQPTGHRRKRIAFRLSR